ncbi:hypothetical protein [Rhizobium sp. BK251]|uniref:hypothetical protein n=1 Tax=Rhizobium sp. BK251 TaxID=2512125 RepID=UPI00104A31DD|nr:hypothetical protein [Rhizobium sp. BK251]TCL72990.1 hypothetical protein EV286_104419 [Rhizobium sp. BK251]
MKYQTLEQLRSVAEIEDYPGRTMSRSERLVRWAELLERNPHWRLSTLHQTEYQPPDMREAMRSDDSPISVAFKDPVLRAAGLADDSYGEAKRFFELDDWQLHEVICYCHFGATVAASTAASQIRAILAPKRASLFEVLRRMLVG